jgi:methanogenic corrinoid protein MtbC1
VSDRAKLLTKLRENIVELQESALHATLRELVQAECPPNSILEVLNDGLQEIGRRFKEGAYYISGLILASEILRTAMDILLPYVLASREGASQGTVLLGTIEGDVHEIGKNLVAWFLRADGFTVTDLGANVPPRVFLREILQREPDVVGISLLLIQSVEPVRRLARLVREAYQDSPPPPLFVGCGFLSPDFDASELSEREAKARELIGVEHVVHDAMDTVQLCRRLARARARG